MVDLPVGVRVYKTRFILIGIVFAGIYCVTPTSSVMDNALVGICSTFIMYEIWMMAKGRTILVISYDGIYHFKYGFISWEVIDRVEVVKYEELRRLNFPGVILHFNKEESLKRFWNTKLNGFELAAQKKISLFGVDCNIDYVASFSNKLISRHRRLHSMDRSS
ncbi:hypothetical protein [Vibrio genomosp. F10]|uniref:hypothetical protein n=1 Tax=Vibrio genomosp. F10 TaxID=723171 RepID=UPI000365878F|nr:hypothetical protein [Vibrio genomosp. F10]OEE94836.1 hypothetical protein A1QK_16135 [Vibrio genomosp. F10 str. 9ZD137]